MDIDKGLGDDFGARGDRGAGGTAEAFPGNDRGDGVCAARPELELPI